jgi:hypothetical protein
MRHGKGTFKLWFDYLALAIRRGIPIDETYYADWGTTRELVSTSFNRWWTQKGRAICAEKQIEQATRVTLELEEADAGSIVVRVPTDLPLKLVHRQVGELVRKYRRRRPTAVSRFHPSGQVNYKTLAAYKRYLEVELDPRNANKSVEDKLDVLRQKYKKIRQRLQRQKETLQRQGKLKLSAKLRFHDPEVFDTLDKEAKVRLTGFSAKKAHRWKMSGHLVMLNVAQGRFPGTDYYGPKLAQRLKKRRQELGVLATEGAF